MNIVIFEDTKKDIQKIQSAIDIVNQKYNKLFKLALVSDKISDIENYLLMYPCNTIFLIDILIGDSLGGLEVSQMVQSHDEQHRTGGNVIAFITDYPQYFLYDMTEKIYMLSFVLKSSERFADELEELLMFAYKNSKEKNLLIFESKELLAKIPISNILYIEKIKKTNKVCVIHDNGYVIYSNTLRNILSRLDDRFIYSHRSFIVNVKKILTINRRERLLCFSKDYSCPYSWFYQKELERLFHELH